MSFTQIEFLLSVFFALGATQQFDLINGSKHAVSSSITCVASIQVISGVTYDLQWRFNKTKICDVFVQLNKIQTMSCSSTIPGFEYYGINSNVSASLSPANFLQMTFKYENLKPENYILDLSLYNDRDTTEYNQTNLEVRYCDSSSDGMPIGAATTPSQCEYGCSANLSCVPDYYSSIVTAQCQADATWSEVNNCTQMCDWNAVSIPSHITRSVGAPAEFFVINNNTLNNLTIFTWKLSSSNSPIVLAELEYLSGSSGLFRQRTPKYQRVTAVSSTGIGTTSSHHNLTFTTNLSDNNTKVTLEREDCSSETNTSDPTTLELKYGDISFFGSEFTTSETNVEYNTTVVFSCNAALYEPGSFTAKLQADATWEHAIAPTQCAAKTTTSATTTAAGETTMSANTTVADTQSTKMETAATVLPTKEPTVMSHITQNYTLGNTACDLSFFRNAAPTISNDTCGGECSVYFRCNEVVGGTIAFTRYCGRNGAWNDTSSPCPTYCSRPKDGHITGISFILIYLCISGVWINLLYKRNEGIPISTQKVIIMGVIKLVCWIIGIGLLFGTTEDFCTLSNGNIVGIVFGVIAILLASIYCFITTRKFFDERPSTAGVRVGPAPLQSNDGTEATEPELVELQANPN